MTDHPPYPHSYPPPYPPGSTLKLGKRFAESATNELVFDKDDDETMDFVAATANLRASLFGIPMMSRFQIKGGSCVCGWVDGFGGDDNRDGLLIFPCPLAFPLRSRYYRASPSPPPPPLRPCPIHEEMAGNIIPAIATTNAVIAGVQVLMALRVLAGHGDQVKTTFLSYSDHRKRFANEALLPPNPECVVCSQAHRSLVVDTDRCTLGQLIQSVLRGRNHRDSRDHHHNDHPRNDHHRQQETGFDLRGDLCILRQDGYLAWDGREAGFVLILSCRTLSHGR